MGLAYVDILYSQIKKEDIDFDVLATVVMVKGDTLWELAEKYYENPYIWKIIMERNRIPDDRRIPVGTVIYIPVEDAKSIVKKVEKEIESKLEKQIRFLSKLYREIPKFVEPFYEDYTRSKEVLDEVLPSINYTFNVPSPINIDDTAWIQLIASCRKPLKDLKEMFEYPGEKKEGVIKKPASLDIEAHLSLAGTADGDESSVRIFSEKPERQSLASEATDYTAEWKWRFQAGKPGTYKLELSLYAIVDGIPRPLPDKVEEITVKVSLLKRASQFWNDKWEFIIGTLLIPLGLGLWRLRKKRKIGERELENSK